MEIDVISRPDTDFAVEFCFSTNAYAVADSITLIISFFRFSSRTGHDSFLDYR